MTTTNETGTARFRQETEEGATSRGRDALGAVTIKEVKMDKVQQATELSDRFGDALVRLSEIFLSPMDWGEVDESAYRAYLEVCEEAAGIEFGQVTGQLSEEEAAEKVLALEPLCAEVIASAERLA